MNLICFINATADEVKFSANMPPMLIGQDLVYLQRSQVDQENGGKLLITLNNEMVCLTFHLYINGLCVGGMYLCMFL